jgi:FtsZ-interacting cell division protein YlmF
MGANGAKKKGWLDKMFRGDAVSDEAYGAQEAAREEQAKQAQEKEAAMDGTYARRPQARGTARKDNVVDFSSRAQARSAGTAGGDSAAGKGEATGGTFARATGSYSSRESNSSTREFGGGSGGGSGGGFGVGGSGLSGTSGPGEAYVIFKRLKDFTTATQVADRMTEHKIVILNLESCDDETARRVLDFIGGVAYACSSMVKRIAGRVFMITPKGVSSDGEFFDEMKGSVEGIYDD